MSQVYFTMESIQAHLNKKLGSPPSNGRVVQINTSSLEKLDENIGINATVDEGFEWSKIKGYPEEEQVNYWITREIIFARMMAYILKAVESGTIKRPTPPGFDLSDYTLNMFGSNKPTSDIDVSVEGPKASYLIAIIEDTWQELTGQPTSRWDVEFYGDFLMLHSGEQGETFLNSRKFAPAAYKILPYVGASILRNARTLEFPLLNEFIASSSVEALKNPAWKAAAQVLMKEVDRMSYGEARETYYKYLGDAEDLKASPLAAGETDEQRHLAIFLKLSYANLFRSENYVLPSTVIHVVRDIQAKSPKSQDDQCLPYHVKLASCALGEFTYLCSALEQIGYMERFSYDSAKVAKYKERLDIAMDRYEQAKAAATAGGRRRGRKTLRRSRATPMRRRHRNRKSTRAKRA